MIRATFRLPTIGLASSLHVHAATSKGEFLAIHERQDVHESHALQLHLAKKHRRHRKFALPGFCKLCDRAVDFRVDRKYGAVRTDGIWIPNWRERLVCPSCKLANRHRAIAWFVSEALAKIDGATPRVYVMEQLTPFFRDCVHRHPRCEWIGSEYLGSDAEPGALRDGIRHEDAERLSLASATVDLIVSNDVLEHVAHPRRAILELERVLAPNGTLLMTIPFHGAVTKNTTRATLDADGEVVHTHPPMYHDNPLDAKGSLVFTDFGWEVVDQLREAGLEDVRVLCYWSAVYGHLGGPQPLFQARKSSR